MESYFTKYRENIFGFGHSFEGPYGRVPLVYADWTASGRLYRPIEERMLHMIGPMVGNTHSESSETGRTMTTAYQLARSAIKRHVNAGPSDALVMDGFGMTSVVNKLQRMLGLRLAEPWRDRIRVAASERPVVFVTHMEHHSNQISWRETICEVVCLEPGADGLVDPNCLEQGLQRYADRPLKIGAFTACSNVTGVVTPYYQLAKLMHQHGGVCFVDFAAAAPYVQIDMHPADPEMKLDAVYFSPHKFLGGPGTSGVLVFDRSLHRCSVPDHPGGGTVDWTNPWNEHRFVSDLELREDGGTPGFLQAIKAALALLLKEDMQPDRMLKRELQLLTRLFSGLDDIAGLHILATEQRHRLGVVSFYLEGIHYNLAVRLLSDRFGVQVRGGCSCAGTYGHYLLHVDRPTSRAITARVDRGDLSDKPGWVRLSIHPTMTEQEIAYIVDAIRQVARHAGDWAQDYRYDSHSNEFYHARSQAAPSLARAWFEF